MFQTGAARIAKHHNAAPPTSSSPAIRRLDGFTLSDNHARPYHVEAVEVGTQGVWNPDRPVFLLEVFDHRNPCAADRKPRAVKRMYESGLASARGAKTNVGPS